MKSRPVLRFMATTIAGFFTLGVLSGAIWVLFYVGVLTESERAEDGDIAPYIILAISLVSGIFGGSAGAVIAVFRMKLVRSILIGAIAGMAVIGFLFLLSLAAGYDEISLTQDSEMLLGVTLTNLIYMILGAVTGLICGVINRTGPATGDTEEEDQPPPPPGFFGLDDG